MKTKFVALLAIVGLALTACGGGGGASKFQANNDSPENVVYMFLSSAIESDGEMFCNAIDPSILKIMEAAGTECKKEAGDMLEGLAGTSEVNDKAALDKEYKPKVNKEGDDKATVTITNFLEGKDSETKNVPVLKVDGKWYIDVQNLE